MTGLETTLLLIAAQLASKTVSAAVNAADDRRALSEFSSFARLNPPCLMEQEIARMDPETSQSISQTLLNVYIGHYLAVVNRSARVEDTEVVRMLDPVSDPKAFNVFDAAKGAAAASGVALAMESIDMAKEITEIDRTWDENNLDLLADFEPVQNHEVSMEAAIDLSKPSSLACGKQLEVTLGSGDQSVKVPVTATLLPRTLNKDVLLRTLEAFLGRDNSYIGRWHRYQAGEFRSFFDYALGIDMIEQDLNLLITDKDGQYEFAKTRQKRGLLSSFVSGKKQMNVVSAMIVMTKRTARDVEAIMRAPLSNSRARKKYFESTGSMILCVVDMDKELVRIYQRGIDEYGDYSYEQIKPAASNPGAMDINAIMRAYKAGEQFSM